MKVHIFTCTGSDTYKEWGPGGSSLSLGCLCSATS